MVFPLIRTDHARWDSLLVLNYPACLRSFAGSAVAHLPPGHPLELVNRPGLVDFISPLQLQLRGIPAWLAVWDTHTYSLSLSLRS